MLFLTIFAILFGIGIKYLSETIDKENVNSIILNIKASGIYGKILKGQFNGKRKYGYFF